VPVSTDGSIVVHNGAARPTHFLVDILGWFPTGSSFTGLTPARLLDTRGGLHATIDQRFNSDDLLEPGVSINLAVAGRGGVPPAGVAGAVALNVTVVAPSDAGYVTVYPLGVDRPNASNVNVAAGQTAANTVLVPLGPDGIVKLFYGVNGPVGDISEEVGTEIIIDVLGFFAGAPLAVDGSTNPVLKPVGLSSTRFGATYADTLAALGSLLGPEVTATDDVYPVLAPNGLYIDSEGNYAFPSPLQRRVCGAETCLSFGGSTPDDLTFMAWSTTDDRFLDAHGIGVGTRRADLEDRGGMVLLDGCGDWIRLLTRDGLELSLRTLSFDPTGGSRVYVVDELAAGTSPRYIGPLGC